MLNRCINCFSVKLVETCAIRKYAPLFIFNSAQTDSIKDVFWWRLRQLAILGQGSIEKDRISGRRFLLCSDRMCWWPANVILCSWTVFNFPDLNDVIYVNVYYNLQGQPPEFPRYYWRDIIYDFSIQ